MDKLGNAAGKATGYKQGLQPLKGRIRNLYEWV
jgi:hypothetical protein